MSFFPDEDLYLVNAIDGVDKVDYATNLTSTLYKDLTFKGAKYSKSVALGEGIEIDNIIYQFIGITHTNSSELFSEMVNVEIPKTSYEFYNRDRIQFSSIRIHVSEGIGHLQLVIEL